MQKIQNYCNFTAWNFTKCEHTLVNIQVVGVQILAIFKWSYGSDINYTSTGGQLTK